MDFLKEFEKFSNSRGMTIQEAISKIALCRMYQEKKYFKINKGIAKKRIKSDIYIQYIKNIPCFGCGNENYIQAQHFDNDGKDVGANRASDYSCIPLCRYCRKKQHILLSVSIRRHVLQNKLMQNYLRCVEGS